MKKICIIVVLSVLVILLGIDLSYWASRCKAAEAVIYQVSNDTESYFYDVLVEGDNYQIWVDYRDWEF